MASVIPTYSPGPPRLANGAHKQRLVLVSIALTLATSIATYTATVTLLYADIRRDHALLQQTVEFNKRLADQEHTTLRQQIEQLRQALDRMGAR